MKGKKQAPKCECVKVAIRVRPMNKHEKELKSRLCVDVDTANNTVACTSDKNETKTFQFDYVYPMDTTQRQVYDEVAFPIVDSIFQGYNGTVFAYGQTGCGKTFTMMGIVTDPNLKGIIPNAFAHIFGFIKTEGESKRFLVRCSFVEIYNEEVRDLLGNSTQKLDIREDPKKGTFIKDLTYITLNNENEIEKCLAKGNKNRHVGQTSMNDQSSRSHSLFTVYVEIEEGTNEVNKKIRAGKLNLVDLAGSERVGKTNATGQTFDEGKKINLSLTALGSVIDALAANRKHIPYKDSKLTRLLADSLGGNTKTVMFANISPASYNYEETVGTLRYASRAKLIKNAPKINEDPKDALLRKYEEEIKKLKEQLQGGGMNIGVQNGENGENGDENYNEFEKENNRNDPEKKALLEKIAQLEKNLVSKNSLKASVRAGGGGENGNQDIDEDEENKRFREYREQQLKQNTAMEEKYKKLQEDKAKQEELLKNDVNNLQKKIKELNVEIEDLKEENGKDKRDYIEDVKEVSRTNQLYKGIISFMLTDNELRKIIDMSRYIEDDDKWKIQPFAKRDKKLVLSNMTPAQISTFIEGNIANRELVIEGVKSKPTKQVIFKNYGDEEGGGENENREEKENEDFEPENEFKEPVAEKIDGGRRHKIILRENKRSDDDLLGNGRKLLRPTKDKIIVDCLGKGKNQSKSQIPGLRKTVPEPQKNNNNINNIFMTKKEREKFEGLGNPNNLNQLYVSGAGGIGGRQHGKIMLNPLGGGGGRRFKLGSIDE